MTTYRQEVSCLLSIHTTDDSEEERINFKQPEGMSAVRHCEVQWEKALSCARLYDESRQEELFIEGPHESIRYPMRTF